MAGELMAGADYKNCVKCGFRAVYDADWYYRVDPDAGWKGQIEALCDKCVEDNKLIVVSRNEIGDWRLETGEAE